MVSEVESNIQSRMKKLLNCVAIVGVALAADTVIAQTTSPTNDVPPEVERPVDPTPPVFERPASGKPIIVERPIVIPPVPPRDGVAPERPERPEVPLSGVTDLRELIRDFQAQREEFLNGRRELLRQLKDATEEQRAALREQLKERMDGWRAEQRAHIEELREQARSIKDSVRTIDDVVNAGQGEDAGR